MTLRAPKNACAKPQLYFSLAMPSLILHAHTSCASFPCFPIFTALLCTEHDRAAPLTKPPHHTMTNTGERVQERDQELGALNWPQTDLQCRSKAQGSLFLPDTPSACFFPGDHCRYPPPHLTCTSATCLHSSQGPCILWISVLLLSTKFPPIYFPLASLICEVLGAEIICKHLESTWNTPSPTANK